MEMTDKEASDAIINAHKTGDTFALQGISTKSEYNFRIVNAMTDAVYDVLDRPKNIVKPVFTEDIGELFCRAKEEMQELADEIFDYDRIGEQGDYAKTRAEAADTCAYLAALIYACDKRIRDEAR